MKWKIEKRRVSELKVWENNPRTIDEDSFKDLKDSITQDGDWGVLVIDIDGIIISGNQRFRALVDQGVKEIDVKVAPKKLTEKERRRIALRANRIKGKDDWDVLVNWDKEDLLKGWLSEDEINMQLGLNDVENVVVDEERLNVLSIEPPESPKLKERVSLECYKIEDYNKIKEAIESGRLVIEDIFSLL